MPFDHFGLYIHLPWCVQKCPYCDFNSHAIKQSLPEAEYLKAILADLKFEAPQLQDRNIQSIFFGGGTPSLFSGTAINTILEAVRQHYCIAEQAEITLEANPGTAEADHFAGYRAAGVNRLSMGLQSMDDDMLKQLGRIHTADESRRAFEMARTAGFDNINLDLMFGLPEQSIEHGMRDLEAVTAFDPEHLSWYQLTLEPNTRFAAQPPNLPSDDICDELQQAGIEMLSASGYQRYEVSAFSKPGYPCRHNLNYWQFGDYLGIGAGAHGKITRTQPTRTARFKHPGEYMRTAGDRAVYELNHPIPTSELLFEFLLNHLRLIDGFSLQQMHEAIGVTGDQLQQALQTPLDQGLLAIDDGRCRATQKGYRYLNEILVHLVPD